VRLTESALTTKNYCTVDQLLIAPHHQSLIRYPDIRRESRFLPTPSGFDAPVRGGGHRWNIAITFGKKKTRTMWLPDGEKSWICLLIFDRHTRRTLHRLRLYIASRGKNEQNYWYSGTHKCNKIAMQESLVLRAILLQQFAICTRRAF